MSYNENTSHYMNMRYIWIYFFVGGFGIGVLWRSFFYLGVGFSVFVIVLAVALFLLYLGSRHALHFFSALVLLGVAFGVIRFDIADFSQGSFYFNERVGVESSFEAVVIDEPDFRDTNTKLIVLAGGAAVTSKEKILITTERYPRYSYGDRLEIEGVLKKPIAFAGNDGKVFDYPAYLGKDGIYYTMFPRSIKKIGEGGGNVVKRTLFRLKSAFLERIGRVIPEPQASLLGGLVVGAKRSLGGDLLDKFRRAGIIHIVVLSGYNVTIVAEFIMRTLSFLPSVLTRSFGVGSIALFAVMTGAGATVVRASIMAILVVIARATGRTYQITHALIVAGFFMVLQNPKIIAFDSSFQLSFMATVGLIYLAPKLESYFGWVPTKWQLREFATATIATQIFVLPMLLYKMGALSIVAFPVNLLVLPVIPITMLLGFFTGVAGFVNTFFALPFSFVTTVLLSYQLFVVDIFARLPFASVTIEHFSLFATVSTYVLYGVILFWLHKNITK